MTTVHERCEMQKNKKINNNYLVVLSFIGKFITGSIARSANLPVFRLLRG